VKGLLELASMPSMLIFLGALSWLAYSMLATSAEVGDGSLMSWRKAGTPLTVAAVALVVNLAAGRLLKRMDR
jgi:hypothetical protein